MQIINGLIQIFMGAVSGYYTNKLAISHLFTDIPLFGDVSWKAVIKKGGNKERLADDLSEIAEDKILGNPAEKNSCLYQELSKEEVLRSLDQCVLAVFEELENSETAGKSLREILREFLTQDQERQLLKRTLETACAEGRLCDVISEQAFTEFCMENFWEDLERFSLELPEETAASVLGEDLCRQVKERLIQKAYAVLGSFGEEEKRKRLEEDIRNLFHQLELENIIKSAVKALEKKTLGEILSDEFFKPSLAEKLISCPDKKYLHDIYESLVEELFGQNLTLSDLLPEGCLTSDAMTDLLAGKIKELQPFLSGLYEDNREFISERIGEALSDAIDEGGGNFLQNMVLFGAKDLILQKMEEFLEEKLPGKIEALLTSPSRETCLALSRMLGEIPFNSILEKLSFDAVYEYIKKEPALQEFLMEKIKKIPLSFLCNSSSLSNAIKKAEESLPEMIAGWLSSGQEGRKEIVEGAVCAVFETLTLVPLNVSSLREKAQKGTLPGKEELFSWIYKQVSEIPLKSIFTVDRVEGWLDSMEHKNGVTLGTVISLIPREPVQKKIRELFTEKAAGYLNIKPVVKEKILALDDDKLCEMMQKFMGTQLAPLNRIGGAIGALVGLLVFCLHPSMEISALSLFLTVICYALIGVGTNVLALHGLFRPYHLQERKWLGKVSAKSGMGSKIVMGLYHLAEKIPGIRNLFCLGYIPEKKEIIAEKLAEFVADNFLHGNDLLPKIEIKAEMVKKFLRENREKITDAAVEKLKGVDISGIAEKLKGKISGDEIAEKIESADLSFLADRLYPAAEKALHKPIEQYFSAEGCAEKTVKGLQQMAGQEKWRTKIFSGLYDRFLKKKTLGEFLSENRTKLSLKITESLCEFLYGEDFRKQAELLIYREVLRKTQKKERTVVSFFGGEAGLVLEKNLETMKGFLFDVVKKKCNQYLLDHEEDLVDRLDLEVQGMINDMADGMELGGMAASMLGTRQLIEKVFRKLFTDTGEIAQGERLSDELFERNETVLLKKTEELLLSAGSVTVEQLEFVFFAQGKTRIVDKSEKEAKAQWINRLCHVAFTAFFNGRTRCMVSFYEIVDGIIKEAGTHRLEELVSCIRPPVLEEALRSLWAEAGKAVGKPSLEEAAEKFLEEYFFRDFLSDAAAEYVPVSKTSFSALFCSNWKRIWKQPGMDILLRKMCSFRDKEIPKSLQKELADAIQKQDSLWEAVRELAGALLEAAAGAEKEPVTEEFAAAVNRLFQYGEDRPGLASAADQIDFGRIMELAVLAMDDAQIEELFQGFAGEYFLSLKLSGALGFVFGVPAVRWVLAVLFIGSEFFGGKRE